MSGNDRTPRELGEYLPEIMPEGQTVRPGDYLLVRLMSQKQFVRKARVSHIIHPVTGGRLDRAVLNRENALDLCLKVYLEDDEKSEYPVWPFQDGIYTYEWVNEWAGTTVVEKPETNGSSESAQTQRFKKLVEPD